MDSSWFHQRHRQPVGLWLVGLLAATVLASRPVTLENTQDVLHDILRANDRKVTIEEIQHRVAEHFTIRLSDMSHLVRLAWFVLASA